jgi:peptidoglycan/LPS O-acetylase OafA/YrhL
MNTSSSQDVKKDFRQDINGLRAWAVVAVVLYHFGVPGFTGGFIGVDVFFVISGFLMTSIIVRALSEGRFSVLRFYLARAHRIIPALAVLAMVLLIFGWLTLPSTDYRMLGKHVAASLTFLSNMVFWLEAGYFDAASKEKWLLHTWSLSVEWQFYLILPLALVGAWKLWPGRARVTALVAIGFVVSLVLSILVSPGHPAAAFYLLPTRAWEMLAGGLVYLLAHRCPVGARAKSLERLGFGLIVASIFVFDESANWPGWGALLPVAGAVLVLMAAQSGSPWTGSCVAQWLGSASYSLYLWHWPVVVALVYLDLEGETVPVAVGLALTLVLGHLSYALVETPTRRHLGQLKMGVGAASLAFATAVVAAPGAAIHMNEGFQHRLPPAVEIAALEANNRNPRMDKCLVGTGVTSPSCRYGGNDLGAVVLGDSHAASVVTAVEEALHRKNLGVLELSYSGCPTISEVNRQPGFERQAGYQCAEFNQWALNKINKVPEHVPLIIMNRTSFYLFGTNTAGRRNAQQPLVYFTKPYLSPEPEFLEEFTEHLIESACTFAQYREVYLVRPIPEMGVDVPNRMARALMFGRRDGVSITIDQYRARHAVVWAAQDEASRRCGVKILDPLPFLCHDDQCIGAKDGRPLYYDEDHLSEFGNRLLIPMFAKVLGDVERKLQTAQAH